MSPQLAKRVRMLQWAVVLVVGVIVVAIVLGLKLIPRLNDGQKVLDAALPGFLAFLGEELKLTPTQLDAALNANFPALAGSIANLPKVTAGWESIPGIDGLTRFDGAPVRSVPELSTYFTSDLIPVLERQRGNYDSLD